MTREEMMAAGLVPEETKHNGHRRAHFHDYNRPGVYMITMVTKTWGRFRVIHFLQQPMRTELTMFQPAFHLFSIYTCYIGRKVVILH